MALVVVYHAAPRLVPGGFVGVDVFFVISGFLITSHLISGEARDGRIRLGRFYARRAKRLLPAALLVLVCTAIGTYFLLPKGSWPTTALQVMASAVYVQNWALAAAATDYSAMGADSSPVQHYWSLSVEEQFYAVWPLLLAVAIGIAKKIRRDPVRGATVALALVAALSLAASMVWTRADPDSAYFSTFTRAWEFAAGGLLALAMRRTPMWLRGAAARTAAPWLGLAAISLSAALFSDETPFPGLAAAVPVLGAVLIIVGNDPTERFSARVLYRWRPVQYVGDISYSIYLWHWPLIVLLPWITDSALTPVTRVVVVLVSLGLGALSKRFVEDPFLRRPLVANTAPRTAVVVVAATLLVFAPAATLYYSASTAIAAAKQDYRVRVTSLPADFGAASAPGPVGRGTALVPLPLIAPDDILRTDAAGRRCQAGTDDFDQLVSCRFGPQADSAKPKVALVGDSHAAQWLPAFASLADSGDLRLTTYLRSGCPLSEVFSTRADDNGGACKRWVAATRQALLESDYDFVIVSAWSGTNYVTAGGESAAQGMSTVWSELIAAGASVIAIRDNPLPDQAGVYSVPQCLERNEKDPNQCSFAREAALVADPQQAAAEYTPGAHLVDLTALFCGPSVCPPVIGGAVVYTDGQHLTKTFAESAAPQLKVALRSAGLG